ncbi:UDP-N-acetyl glucosamine 2-epimerase [Piscinibacter aquaticus]|uniref:UDP-N-acetyl glucosamine 2-epimerase n=1 Tax=Piscinibacter aquaticus TaxID=392597 RepID=A0A5C6U417_9BURK|nr:UDP-N-acetyl glucosamine 2-epimerase [Piscinibacter aquaticus]
MVGGQGEHVKAAALMHAFAAQADLPVTLLVRCYANSAFERHRQMFEGLDVAGRLVSLGIAGGTYAGRAAELMKRFEFVVDHCQPAAVIVFDGSDAALSCGLVASRKGLPVLHVGAGLRSGTTTDAADITRRPADQLADVLYTTESQANQQLAQEGVAAERIRFVGNTLADALQVALRTKLPVPNPRERLGLPANLLNDRNGYGVVVLDGRQRRRSADPVGADQHPARRGARRAADLADAHARASCWPSSSSMRWWPASASPRCPRRATRRWCS